MESIFESLENLQVSEGCFEDIVGLVEEYLSEKVTVERVKKAAISSLPKREAEYKEQCSDDACLPAYPPLYYQTKSRYEAAKRLANGLPDNDKRDFARLRKAAQKVTGRRYDEDEDAWTFNMGKDEQKRRGERLDKAVAFATKTKGHGKIVKESLSSLVEKELSRAEKTAYINKMMGEIGSQWSKDFFDEYNKNPQRFKKESFRAYKEAKKDFEKPKKPIDQAKVEQNKKLYDINDPNSLARLEARERAKSRREEQ